MPPGKKPKQSGEISWACFPKVVRTNEIARLVIITYIALHYNSKILYHYLSIRAFLSGFGVKCFERCWLTLLQKCALAQEIKLGSDDLFSSCEGGVWVRDYGDH